jgi:predicted O-methyltransferase YrrM
MATSKIIFSQNFAEAEGLCPPPGILKHPVFALAGMRPVLAQHTREEHETIQKWARGRRTLIEIGVAEGASALGAREVMHPNGRLYLIDPFHLGRIPLLDTLKRAAHAAVSKSRNGRVEWIRKFSYEALVSWCEGIDFLVIDGDDSEDGVDRDWHDWSPFVVPGGVVLFHDARVFPGGWTGPNGGPVRLVDRIFRNPGAASSRWQIVDEVHSLVVVQRHP